MIKVHQDSSNFWNWYLTWTYHAWHFIQQADVSSLQFSIYDQPLKT